MMVGIVDHEVGTRDIRRLRWVNVINAIYIYNCGNWKFFNGRAYHHLMGF